MKKRRVRRFVLPSLFIVLSVTAFFGIAILNNILLSEEMNYDYSKSLMKDATQAVLSEQKTDKKELYRPYASDNVEVLVSYYDKDASDEEKERALIVYDNTYMPASGVVYASDETFEVMSVMDGQVTNIKEDNILGMMVEVTHNTNLISYYYSLKDIPVNIGTEVKAGTILGRATPNNIYGQKNNFLFEVYYQGKSLNPEKFYNMNIDELM